MKTTTLKPVKRNPSYLADQLSQYDRDILSNAEYIKDSIDYNDNPVTSWLGKSSVDQIQIEQILRAYVQLVLNNYIPIYNPKGYPKQYIERVGAAAGQTSNLTYRSLNLLYYGVKQNRIKTSRILNPKGITDPNYRVPDEPGYFERMEQYITSTTEGIVNKVGSLTHGVLDAGNNLVDLASGTAKGLGTLGKYGVPLAVGSAAAVVIYFGYNIAKTSTAGHVVKAIPSVKVK